MSKTSAVFQFTHPGKGATLFGSTIAQTIEFQFTHPGKGATVDDLALGGLLGVSIHAPWEGCDLLSQGGGIWQVKFQFTHPGKGATATRQSINTDLRWFQFTHPGKGATG